MARDYSLETVKIRRPCFYDIFSSNSSFHRLRIPARFSKYMEGKTSGSVTLMGPSGNTWLADLIHQNDDLYLDCGWQSFVKDHFIEGGDLLVFRYDGELCFTVQVFDQSSCEKEAAFCSSFSQCPSTLCKNVGQKRKTKEEALSSKEYFGCDLKRVRDGTSETCPDCTDKNLEDSSLWERNGKEDDLNLHSRGSVEVFSEREKKVAEPFISCFPYFVRITKRF